MVRVVVVLSLAGCGRIGFRDHAPLDGTTTADAARDAPADARPDGPMLGPCTPLAISDDFNDGTRAAIWTLIANNPVTVAETGGQLEAGTYASAPSPGIARYENFDTP